MRLGTFPLCWKKQQAILKKVQKQQSRMPEMPVPQNPTSPIEEFQILYYNHVHIIFTTVLVGWGEIWVNKTIW